MGAPGAVGCRDAKSIPIALAIQSRFDNLDYVYDLGELSLNISGCMNSCGHHHVGNIGILGVDKDGSEWYQVSLGGEQGTGAGLPRPPRPVPSQLHRQDRVVEGGQGGHELEELEHQADVRPAPDR